MLVVCMLLILGINENTKAAQQFQDIAEGHEAFNEINYLVEKGVINGYAENSRVVFKPYNNITRSQAAKMLVIASGQSPLYVTQATYRDVPTTNEFSPYVERAVQLGYFSKDLTDFKPYTPLSRGEMSYVLVKAFNLNHAKFAGKGTVFADVNANHEYAQYVNAIYYEGITKGSNGNFMAEGNVLRSQFASFVARASDTRFTLEKPQQETVKPPVTKPQQPIIAKAMSTTDGLNIRSSIGVANNLVGQVNKGDKLHIYALEGDWAKVNYNNQVAYAYSEYLQFVDPKTENALGTSTKQVIANDDLNLYFDATSSATKITYIKAGTKLPVYKNVNGYYLTVVNGIPGYIVADSTKDVVIEQPKPTPPPVTPPTEGKPLPPIVTPPVGNAATKARVTYDFVNVRAAADNNSQFLGTLQKGQEVAVTRVTGNFVEVKYNGRIAYIYKPYVKLINQNGKPLQNRIIVIDAGHGGKDPGTVFGVNSEKVITLAVAQKVQQKLKAAGADVRMTREVDKFLPLQTIVDISHANNAETFVSIHVNSASSNAYGTETYYYTSPNYPDTPDEERYLAKLINDQIVKDANMYNRGVKSGNFQVIRNTDRVALLVELGFLTNDSDRAKMTNDAYQNIYAEAIVKGLTQFYAK